MFCRKCGAKLSENSKFCPDCGTQVPVPVSPPPGATAAVAPSQQPKSTMISITEANSFARDKLRHGDLPANIASQLVSSGFAPDHARTIIDGATLELRKESRRSWRKKGGQLMSGGIAAIIVTFGPLYEFQTT